MLGRKNASKKESQIKVLAFASETICQVSQQWNKLDMGKKPRGYDGTGLRFESHHKTELS